MADWTTLSEIFAYPFRLIGQYFDGSLVDVGSIIVAVCFVLWHRSRLPCDDRCAFLSRETGRLLVNAVSIFPLLLLSASIVSSKLTELLLSGSKITLTIAGSYALFTMLEDLLTTTNAVRQQQAESMMMGPPAPKLAPQQHMLPPSHTPAHQTGKVMLPSGKTLAEKPLTRSQKRRRALAAKKQAAQKALGG